MHGMRFMAHNSFDSVSKEQDSLRSCLEAAMKMHYRFNDLSKAEREYHEMILLEEIDVQSWYAISFSSIFGEEIFITVQ
jgi:hypothetical protein